MSEQDSQPGSMPWMIYGANGYAGELIARESVRQGLNPVLAGRNEEKVKRLANELGLKATHFSLNDTQHIAQQIGRVQLVLNCAGPFSATAEPLITACLASGSHYLDITGEITVFELAHSLNERARTAGTVLCPGVGFDVIPTDCIAASLKAELPDATHLALGFDSRSGFSPGTAKTSVEGLAQGGKVRRNGKIETVPLAHKVRRINFGDGEKNAITIPWGDIATAYYTTGIPNIEVFLPGFPKAIVRARRANYIRPLMRISLVQKLLKAHITKAVQGPDEATRQSYPWRQEDSPTLYRKRLQSDRERLSNRGPIFTGAPTHRRGLHTGNTHGYRAGDQPTRLRKDRNYLAAVHYIQAKNMGSHHTPAPRRPKETVRLYPRHPVDDLWTVLKEKGQRRSALCRQSIEKWWAQ